MNLEICRNHTELRMYSENDSEFKFYSKWWMLLGKSKAEVFDKNDVKIYSIRKRFKILKLKLFYEITNSKNELVILELNRKGTIYELNIGENKFELKIHKGRKKSVFKNNMQIASIDDALLSILDRNKIAVTANINADLEIIFLLYTCINIDNTTDNEITFDFGHIGKAEEIDSNWKPK